MVVDEGGDDGDGDDVAPLVNILADLLVLHTDNILTVDLEKVVVDEEPVPGGWGVHGDAVNFTLAELEADVPGGILMEG